MSNNISVIEATIYGARETFSNVITAKDLSFDKEAAFAMQAICAKDFTLSVAIKNQQSVFDAMTNVAAIGLSLNPAKKQAYLVPMDGRINLQISYMGLIDLATATGAIRWAQAALVYQNDTLTLNGYDKAPTHQYNPFSSDRGEVVGVYVVVKTEHGDYLTHTMDIASAYAIRDRSAAWKASKSGPWKTDEGEMIKKTCVKQAYKYWPKTPQLDQAIQYLNTEGGEGLATLAAPVVPEIPAALLAEADLAALMGVATYGTFWQNTGKDNRKLLSTQHEKLKMQAMRADATDTDSRTVKEAGNEMD